MTKKNEVSDLSQALHDIKLAFGRQRIIIELLGDDSGLHVWKIQAVDVDTDSEEVEDQDQLKRFKKDGVGSDPQRYMG